MLVGGKAGDAGRRGLFYEPTVLVDVDHGMDCMREETFGPTLPVMKVARRRRGDREGQRLPVGLSGSMWTRDKTKAMAVARQLNTGTVNINNVITGLLQFGVPMAGWKESGLGSRSGGADGIRKYCRTKSIVADRMAMKKELLWYPYSPKKGNFVQKILRFLSAKDWRRRLGR